MLPVSAKGDKLKGEPLPVVEAKDDHTFELNHELLESVLLRPEVKDRHVVVLSVAGAFRKGKSFLLDFFLRYLHAQVGSGGGGKTCNERMNIINTCQ